MKTSDLDAAIYAVRKRWPKARAIQSQVGGLFLSLGLGDGRELAYRFDGDEVQLWKDAAANVNKFDTIQPPVWSKTHTINPITKKIVKKPPLGMSQWLTKECEQIALTEMSDSHLQNTINMLGRRMTSLQQRTDVMKLEQKRRADLAEEEKKKRAKLQLQGGGSRMFRDEE